MYRRTLNDTNKTNYISAVKYIFTVPSGLRTAHLPIALRWFASITLHTQVADKVHLTVSTNKFHDVNRKATSEIPLILPCTDIFILILGVLLAYQRLKYRD